MTTSAVGIDGITKRFDSTTALESVTLDIEKGELFGFIGPDGAGKTTLFRILVTLLLPDAGRATVLGRDVTTDIWELRRRVGYMPGRFSLYPDLSVEENLHFFASVFGVAVAEQQDLIAPIYDQLAPFKDRRAGALSGGMKQKLALCCALVHRPEILFLDEPTTGVDAVSRREFWELLDRLKASGLTIVVSTPYMDEADRCGRVALIQRGRILGIDTPARIAASFGRPLFTVRAAERYPLLLATREYENTATVFPFGDVLHYTDRRNGASVDQISAELGAFLSARGFPDVVITAAPPTIEDTFMARMGEPERAA
ncbi:MAG TPA: ABC transporter ATP-binding protein [Gemmatimonadaceae bacterium]|nr:ABC transporter ATP-binding protein [Gemmatimonadaceae bacterium]